MARTDRGWTTVNPVPDRRGTLLVVSDVVLLATLILFGQWSHGIDPVSDPAATVETMLPFITGWLIVSLLAGAYDRDVISAPIESARLAAIAWLAGANIGLILRSSPVFDGSGDWPFNLVITGFGLLALVGWRLVYAVVRSR